MSDTKKKKKRIVPPEELVHFSWGGRTQEWEEEADQVMHTLQDQLEDQETKEEIKKKIEYGKQKQYW
ncbi:hypothetical protein SAMN05660297_00022 [Natronincola peptidivorans]|uniref:Uncharacterized protein n=1 Tax=Natronincola peptidivorans TaxID=426128 RepID=A0A1H9Y471_9FIRM|nr:hypothetical protein [Natronincola peptidivorans]SES63622.1 hypothetical protein SAMN05660297_00022 [Natronincola peptidivorans]